MYDKTKGFSENFIKRTETLISEYNGSYEITLLLNCTLSLICLPIDEQKAYLDKIHIIDYIKKHITKIMIIQKDQSKEKITLSHLENFEKYNNTRLLEALRNGIAHTDMNVNGKTTIEEIQINGSFFHKYEITFIFSITNFKNLINLILNEYKKIFR